LQSDAAGFVAEENHFIIMHFSSALSSWGMDVICSWGGSLYNKNNLQNENLTTPKCFRGLKIPYINNIGITNSDGQLRLLVSTQQPQGSVPLSTFKNNLLSFS